LKTSADNLPNLLDAAYAESSIDKYKSAWFKWKAWSDRFPEVSAIPAEPFFIALYFNDLVAEKSKVGAINNAINGIRWMHIRQGYESPTYHPFLQMAAEGARRLCSSNSTSNQKEPITLEIIGKLIDKIGVSHNLMNLRLVVLTLIGFSGFLRISEILQMKVEDVRIFEDHIKINIPKSKCDQLRFGHIVHIARTGTKTCPVYWLKKYLEFSKLSTQPNAFVFCRLNKTKKGHNANGAHNISYSRAREIFLEGLSSFVDVKSYGLHSMRSGGASAAANNSVCERLIGKHGRWKSTSSRDRYIKDSKSKRLSVSTSLGL